ncbi:MAG: hypothetical protein SPL67_06190 [Prevotella sp.]|jgi:hypothetical protein|nr:hypothetical protein [Prevotella sp.]
MKKEYIAPACRIAKVEASTLLEGSITETTGTVLDKNFTGQAKRGIWDLEKDN